MKSKEQKSHSVELPRLLEDGPALHDEFGSHKHIARGIASLIQNQSGGHVIGLRGPFGSGKSTTVAQLHSLLPNDSWTVINFDAWTHRGHDLMRAFLANTIKQLDEQIGINNAEKIRKEIINETETKTTQTQSTVNALGQTLAVIGVLATVITVGLGAVHRFGISDFGFVVKEKWLFWLGWTPWSLFIFVLLIGFFGPWPKPVNINPNKEYKNSNKWIKRNKVYKAFKNYMNKGGFSIQFVREGERIQTVTTSSSASNSITFQEKFSEVIGLALQETERRLVIVLDNMDRLEEDEQLSAWATVQAFVDAKFPQKNQVWFLVPLSYIEIRSSNISNTDKKKESAHNDNDSEIRIARLRENLADKIFLTEFRVPEVVLTDWVAYVNTLCKEILLGINHEIRAKVARVIVSWTRNEKKRPKPRQLRAIVNQIGGLYHQWKNDVALDVIALYVVKVQELESRGEILSDNEIIEDFRNVPGRAAIPRKSISQDLAMLHFSAPRNKAFQILVQENFTEALLSGKPLTDEGLAIPNVETVLDHLVREILSEPKPGSTVLIMAACLDNAAVRGVEILNQTWGFLFTHFITSESTWILDDTNMIEEGAEMLAKHINDRSNFDMAFAQQIGNTLSRVISVSRQEAESD